MPQQQIRIAGAGPFRGWRADDQDELAAQFTARGALRQGDEVAAPDFLVHLGELAAQGGLAGTELGGEVGKRRGDPRSAFKQNESRRDPGERRDAAAACRFLRRQEPGKEKLVGRQA